MSNDWAERNFSALGGNPYPGRIIIIGRSTAGDMVQLCCIMGRSENSRNRLYERDGGKVFTTPADPSKVADPSLIIYNAMDETSFHYVVSNGHQTDAVVKESDREILSNILREWEHEPDDPNFTPRITGVCRRQEWPAFELALVRKSSIPGVESDRFYFQYDDLEHGLGRCLTTYTGDGNPLPSFIGEPLVMPLEGMSIKEIGLRYWYQLNKDNRISIAVKLIREGKPSEVFIKNRFTKV